MRGNDTLINVIEMVEGISENHHDQIIPLADIEFENLDTAHVCGREIEVLPSAQRLIANRLRVPHQYLVRCPQALQEQNLNYWMREEQKNRDTFFCRFDGYKLRAVFTQRYTAFDNKDILTQMVEYGFSLDTEIHYTFDDSLMNLKIPEYDRMFSFPGDDKMIPGTSIANSEVGVMAFSIEAYIYRLVCSNGLISKTSIGKRFKHISDKAMIEFEDVISEVIYQSSHNQNRLRISTETSVGDANETFDSFNRRFLITKKEAEAVSIAFNREQGNTMFNIINAYTRGAQHPGLTAEESYKLERTGGQILALVK
ncbi:DUF932 [Desulfonema limicola]|uniref:DUF932 n=1 Tax=Desulfonema limicola TaxID=45656 RepID=A0A975BCM3_9BACT|nr:DUF932 domain-containing protein [Desulfonema limicola]QTA82720.1 DUF932 [Desulfonema limicola]